MVIGASVEQHQTTVTAILNITTTAATTAIVVIIITIVCALATFLSNLKFKAGACFERFVPPCSNTTVYKYADGRVETLGDATRGSRVRLWHLGWRKNVHRRLKQSECHKTESPTPWWGQPTRPEDEPALLRALWPT